MVKKRQSNNARSMSQQGVAFFKKHPILLHVLLIFVAFMVFCYIAMIVLDIFTEHGTYKVVPDMKGISLSEASQRLSRDGFHWEITDSIYNDEYAPGTVVEQNPKENSKVKSNRTIYLIINAFSPRSVTFPSVCEISERQAVARLRELGLKNIIIDSIDSPYKGLVIECTMNGLPIRVGSKVPSSANITLYVGSGTVHTDSLDSVIDALSDEDLFGGEEDFDFLSES